MKINLKAIIKILKKLKIGAEDLYDTVKDGI